MGAAANISMKPAMIHRYIKDQFPGYQSDGIVRAIEKLLCAGMISASKVKEDFQFQLTERGEAQLCTLRTNDEALICGSE